MISQQKMLLVGSIVLVSVLRFSQFGKVPISLHGDEVGVGYNAYSLLETGKDEYGVSWPLSFRADIPPLNFYLTIPFIAIFGKTELAVRLPSAIYGVLLLITTFWFARELFSKRIALAATFLLAVSPWHVQASRIAHEANLGLLLQVTGTLFFLKGLKKHSLLFLATIFWALSFYAYHGPRLTTPLLITCLVFVFRQRLRTISKRLIINNGLVFLLLILPVVGLILNQPLTQNRLAGISIFIRAVTIKPAQVLAGFDSSPLIGLAFHNSALTYGLAILRQYVNYLNLDYLYFDSSNLRYFNVSNVGLEYIWGLPFLAMGLYQLIKSVKPKSKVPLLWLLIAPLPGAITLGSPNVGRSFMLLPMLQIVTAVGVITFLKKYNQAWLSRMIAFLLLANIAFFGHQYFVHSKHEFAAQWEYGMKEVVQKVGAFEPLVSKVIFTDAFKEPYIFVLFYGNKDAGWIHSVPSQRHHFIGYKGFAKYQFRAVDWEQDKLLTDSLIVGTGEEIPAQTQGLISEIAFPEGVVLFRIIKT